MSHPENREGDGNKKAEKAWKMRQTRLDHKGFLSWVRSFTFIQRVEKKPCWGFEQRRDRRFGKDLLCGSCGEQE